MKVRELVDTLQQLPNQDATARRVTLAGHTQTIFHAVFAIGQTLPLLPASIFALDRAPLRLGLREAFRGLGAEPRAGAIFIPSWHSNRNGPSRCERWGRHFLLVRLHESPGNSGYDSRQPSTFLKA